MGTGLPPNQPMEKVLFEDKEGTGKVDAELVDVAGMSGEEDHSFEQLYDMVGARRGRAHDKEKPWWVPARRRRIYRKPGHESKTTVGFALTD